MAMTIAQSFNIFKTNLEITDLQSLTTSKRQQYIRKVLDTGLIVENTFLTGSYSRDTMIAPLNQADIDIFVILDSGYYRNNGQEALLDLVTQVLKNQYTSPKIGKYGQAVTIHFKDFMVDVVPAFNRQGGGYLIPNTIMSSWIPTDPKKHVSLFSEANKKHEGTLKPIIKMLKQWNKNISFDFSNFHIEVLAYHIFDGIKITDYTSGIRYFFDKARTEVKTVNPDPAGYSEDVGAYLNTQEKIDRAISNMETAYRRAFYAESYGNRGKVREAIDEYRKIFGRKFPAYG